MEVEKSIEIEVEDNGYEREIFQQTFEIKIEERDLLEPFFSNYVCENKNIDTLEPDEACENENENPINGMDTMKVEYDYGFLRNEENFLLETNSLDTDNKSKSYYVDPRIEPCVVLIERCKITQTVGLNCRSTKKMYVCDICNECFTEKYNVLRHKRYIFL